MSVERVERSGKPRYRVRWREAGSNRAKTFDRKGDADRFDTEIRQRRQAGMVIDIDAGRERLADFGREWWGSYAAHNLAPATLEVYAGLWDKHVLSELGGYELRELTAENLTRYRGELTAHGVGDPTIRKDVGAPTRRSRARCRVGENSDQPGAASEEAATEARTICSAALSPAGRGDPDGLPPPWEAGGRQPDLSDGVWRTTSW